jgi:AcrR family transcriptional regulator
MEKTDIRARFTQKVLRDSLIEIMKTKSVLNITIKEICDKAGVSRSTFYTYHKDQYDLLRQMEDETFVEIEKITEKYRGEKKFASTNRERIELLQNVLDYVAGNSNSIQVLLSENGDTDFQIRYFNSSLKLMRQFIKSKEVGMMDENTIKYASIFMIGGYIALMHEWLKNGMDIPVPEMAKIMAKLVRDMPA